MARYSRDPYWITAKYPGYCAKCKTTFKAGEKIYYYPNNHTTYSGECAQTAFADFACAAMDEDAYNA
jgi:hypothetical protein